jgi:hypothetical protein
MMSHSLKPILSYGIFLVAFLLLGYFLVFAAAMSGIGLMPSSPFREFVKGLAFSSDRILSWISYLFLLNIFFAFLYYRTGYLFFPVLVAVLLGGGAITMIGARALEKPTPRPVKVSLDEFPNENLQAFIFAVDNTNREKATHILAIHPELSINEVSVRNGESILCLFAKNLHVEAVKLLLELEADPRAGKVPSDPYYGLWKTLPLAATWGATAGYDRFDSRNLDKKWSSINDARKEISTLLLAHGADWAIEYQGASLPRYILHDIATKDNGLYIWLKGLRSFEESFKKIINLERLKILSNLLEEKKIDLASAITQDFHLPQAYVSSLTEHDKSKKDQSKEVLLRIRDARAKLSKEETQEWAPILEHWLSTEVLNATNPD